MSYEATIKLDGKYGDKRISVESGGTATKEVWLHFGMRNASAHTFLTAEQARELAAALLDAAADVEPVDLTAQPVGSVA